MKFRYWFYKYRQRLRIFARKLEKNWLPRQDEHVRKLGNHNSEYGVGVKKIETIMEPYYKAYGNDYFAADFSA